MLFQGNLFLFVVTIKTEKSRHVHLFSTPFYTCSYFAQKHTSIINILFFDGTHQDNLLFLSFLTVSAVSLFCTKMKLQISLEVSKIWVQFKSKYLHQQYFHCLHNYIAAEIRGRKITTSFTFAAQNSILFIVQMNTSLINQFHNIYIFSLLFYIQ